MEDLKLSEQNQILKLNREYYSLLRKAQRKFRRYISRQDLFQCRLVGILKAVRSYKEELGCLSSWLYQQVYFETLNYVRGFNKELPDLNRVDISLERIPACSSDLRLIEAKIDWPEKYSILFEYYVGGKTLLEVSSHHSLSLFKLRQLINN